MKKRYEVMLVRSQSTAIVVEADDIEDAQTFALEEEDSIVDWVTEFVDVDYVEELVETEEN